MSSATVTMSDPALSAVVDAVARLSESASGAGELITLITDVETLKNVLTGVQMSATTALVRERERDLAAARDEIAETAGDFDAWHAARERARSFSVDGELHRTETDPVIGAPDSGVFSGGRKRRGRKKTSRIGVYAEVGLARRQSPTEGARFTTVSYVLHEDMPFVKSLVETGLLTEYRAWLVVKGARALSAQDRRVLDDRLRDIYGTAVGNWSNRYLERTIQALACAIDAAAVVAQAELSAADARTSVRAATGGMAYFTALMPVADAVAIHAALTAVYDSDHAEGDERSKGAHMSQTLTARALGTAPGQAHAVELLVITDSDTLVTGEATPDAPTTPGDGAAQGRPHDAPDAARPRDTARRASPDADAASPERGQAQSPAPGGSALLHGYGILTGPEVLAILRAAHDDARAGVRIRRVQVDRRTGALLELDSIAYSPPAGWDPGSWPAWLAGLPAARWVGHESSSRLFTGMLRALVLARDGGLCRTPWCGAPARHIDHIMRHHDNGPTSFENGQGLCVRCNLVKEQPGWSATRLMDGTVVTRTPTGHTYASATPEALPGRRPRPLVTRPLTTPVVLVPAA